MTDQITTLKVNILDKEYQVACPPEETEALRKSAEYLDRQMREIRSKASVIGLDRIAVMAALNITNDLLRQTRIARKLKLTEENQVSELCAKLDQALTRLKAN